MVKFRVHKSGDMLPVRLRTLVLLATGQYLRLHLRQMHQVVKYDTLRQVCGLFYQLVL